MSEIKAYEALSSKTRLEILRALHKKPLSILELSKKMNLQPITLRHHLRSLEDAGFIEGEEERIGIVGRPKVLYRIAKESKRITYPKRHYLSLISFLLENLQSVIGQKKTASLLRRVGKNMGEAVVTEIQSHQHIREWSFAAFIDFFVKGYLDEAGSEPEIIEKNENMVVYRVHNCLFFELAVKMPETMCDVLHDAFHGGISNAMNQKGTISRLTCMGHGDPYCEHRCEWQH